MLKCASLADGHLLRLTDAKAAEAFVNSAEVVVIGFLEVTRVTCIEREEHLGRGQKHAFILHLTHMPTTGVHGALYYADVDTAASTRWD